MPLVVLLVVFSLSLLLVKLSRKVYDFPFAGRIAMSAMLLFAAVGHFAFTEEMAMMLPPFVPYKTE